MIERKLLAVKRLGIFHVCSLLCGLCFWPGFNGNLAAQQSGKPTDAGNSIYAQPRLLTLWERTSLANVGSRLTVPGSERMMISGQFFQAGKSAATMQVTSELPDKFRVVQSSQPGKLLILNGGSPGSNANHSDDDKDLIESLYADTLDQFFLGKPQGAAYRLIGGHVRADDGATKNYSGPFYRVHQVIMPLKYRNETGIRVKNFLFDTNGGLLSAVRYQIVRGINKVNVSVEYTGWRTLSGQAVPAAIRRVENGMEAWHFDVSSAAFGVTAADNAFKLP